MGEVTNGADGCYHLSGDVDNGEWHNHPKLLQPGVSDEHPQYGDHVVQGHEGVEDGCG